MNLDLKSRPSSCLGSYIPPTLLDAALHHPQRVECLVSFSTKEIFSAVSVTRTQGLTPSALTKTPLCIFPLNTYGVLCVGT